MNSLEKDLISWVKEFTGDIKDRKKFINEIKVISESYKKSLSEHKEYKDANAKHKNNDNLLQLSKGQEELDKFFLQHKDNPLLNSSQRFELEGRIMQATLIFQKASVNYWKQIQSDTKDEISKLPDNQPNCKLSVEGLSNDANLEEINEYIARVRAESVRIRQSALEFVNSSIDYFNHHGEKLNKIKSAKNSYFSSPKEYHRNSFVLSLIKVFTEQTKRTSIERTSKEISLKKKSPFQHLLKICYKHLDIYVSEKTLEKHIASAKKIMPYQL